MTGSVFDHPLLGGLFADDAIAALWSADAQLAHMIAFEAAWSRALGATGLADAAVAARAAQAIEAVTLDMNALRQGAATDGLVVPALVKQLKAVAGAEAVHTGTTSQDVIDTALACTLVATLDVLEARVQSLTQALSDLNGRFGDRPMMGRTRMQAALPITVRDRVETWRLPLVDHAARLAQVRPRVAMVQVGGAAGDRAALGAQGQAMADHVAAALGLTSPARSWHARRDGLGEFAGCLTLLTGTLGKMGQDLCLMAQQGVDEVALAGGGGSSAMPHKQNPILAELLVTLARFNAVQVAGMQQAMVHEQERSGAAWTLEWMILPQMAMATGRALTAADTLTASVTRMGAA